MRSVPSVSVAGGGACALVPSGTVECWGTSGAGELGDGTSTGPQTCEGDFEGVEEYPYPCSTTPVAVSGLSGVTAISGTCALLGDGTVQCWGDNSFGELGDGMLAGPETCGPGPNPFDPTNPCSTTPVAVSGLNGVTAISASGAQACALLSDGTVQCWGDNYFGELGNGTTTCSPTPVAVVGL